jgi:hypothetical protein
VISDLARLPRPSEPVDERRHGDEAARGDLVQDAFLAGRAARICRQRSALAMH